MQNYFNYFTEIEERFQQRRGSLLLLSTLDWALIETWRDAGVPLEAVLRGIDESFDRYEARKAKGRARRVNGLAWCAQGVMEAAEQMREASTGAAFAANNVADSGLESKRIVAHLEQCAEHLQTVSNCAAPAQLLLTETASRLKQLAAGVCDHPPSAEELELTLRTLEEKLLAMLLATTPEEEMTQLRAQASREIAPFRSRMAALQIRQIEQQFLDKRLLEKFAVPRLSLFYMRNAE